MQWKRIGIIFYFLPSGHHRKDGLFSNMMSEEPSDWDSMSDPATEDQPSSLDVVGRNDAMVEKIDSKPKTRPKSAHNRAQDSPSLIAQKQRISEGIRNQSFDLSDNSKTQKDSFSKNEKKYQESPLTNKVCI